MRPGPSPASLASWRVTLAVLVLTGAATVASLAAAWLVGRDLEGLRAADVARHGVLSDARREVLLLDDALARVAGAAEAPSAGLLELAGRVAVILSRTDLAAMGAPADSVARLKEAVNELEKSFPSSRKPLEESPIVYRRSFLIARVVTNHWLAIEKTIDEAALAQIRGATSRGGLALTAVAVLWAAVLILSSALAVLGWRRSTAALTRFLEAARSLGSGESTRRIEVSGDDDLVPILDGFNEMADGLRGGEERSLAAGRERDMRLQQIREHLARAVAGKPGDVLHDSTDPAMNEVQHAVNEVVRALGQDRLALAAEKDRAVETRWRIEEDAHALLDLVRSEAFGVAARMPQLSAGSPLHALSTELVRIVDRLHSTIVLIRENAEELARASREMAENSGFQEREFVDEYRVIHETAASVNEVSVAAKQSSQMVEYVFRSAQEAMETAEEGYGMIHRIMEGMAAITAQVNSIAGEILSLSEKSQEIGVIVQTISDISKQTNLLALNAAIEAAGAGEHGRGFAVVAKEIRELASRSSGATKEIENLIAIIRQTTNAAVMATEQGSKKVQTGSERVDSLRDSFKRIMQKFQEVVESAHQISTASREQTVGARQVAQAISDIDSMMKASLDNVSRFRQAVDSYRKMTDSLRGLSENVTREE
jgi:methyl-accepting chemotaxis protein